MVNDTAAIALYSPARNLYSLDMAAPNFSNRTVWVGDNLHVMRGINSACIDLIYLDPPFNSNQDFAAPIGIGYMASRRAGGNSGLARHLRMLPATIHAC